MIESEASKSWCVYYRAHVKREKVWFFVAVLRSYEHLCFDRTYDIEASIFEFFVPPLLEKDFLAVISLLKDEGIVSDLVPLNNRVLEEGAF